MNNYERIMDIDIRTKPKFKIAKDFQINWSTLTMMNKQCLAEIEAFQSGDFSFKHKRTRSGILMRLKSVTK